MDNKKIGIINITEESLMTNWCGGTGCNQNNKEQK